ncbi:DUF4349 domain-containing protein [Nonomuraea spiralis]|uniref:DUF4349 domain-containing protein n=1 Tax=Nonomuraea spiralis TaxID=46182 RepID=A0ABV5IEI9_9ACTN|nr:DUF4349 domain-containing protein [Nonomuraea spiralis]GGS69645.1 hypothetical protein GCM10010176_010270 [Nonomuraea spiralis]
MRLRLGIALSACATLLLAGCGGGYEAISSGGSSEAAPAAAPQSLDSASAEDNVAAKRAPERADSAVSDVKLIRQQDRQVIYTGSMTVRAKEVTAAAQQAKQIVTAAGGYLSKEESNTASDTEDSAMLEFKIPPTRYAEVTGRLGKELGKQLSMNQGTQDVTLQVADVDSRLKSAQESLASLRTLLKRADTIGQVLQVEKEISSREADLEALQAQQKELATQVSMATMTLRLVGPVAVVEDPAEEPAGFLGGLKAGWGALVSFTKTALTVLGALLPWLVVMVPLVAVAVFLVRRNRARRRPAPAAPTEPKPSEPEPSEPGAASA